MQRRRLVSMGVALVSVLSFISCTTQGCFGDRQGMDMPACFPAVEFPVGAAGRAEGGKVPVACEVQRQEKSSTYGLSDKEKYLLMKLAMAEAESEDTAGKALVILVAMNRAESKGFPDTVEGVIYENMQFSPVFDGRFDGSEPDADCRKALGMVMDGWDESRGALYFESESGSTWHRENLKKLFTHGKHIFYKEKGR